MGRLFPSKTFAAATSASPPPNRRSISSPPPLSLSFCQNPFDCFLICSKFPYIEVYSLRILFSDFNVFSTLNFAVMALGATTDSNDGAGGDTQLMDIDPLLSDCETDDGSGSGSGEEKTSILYGETQVLDDAESAEEDGCGRLDEDGFQTQLVDTCDEAAVELEGVKTQLLDTYQETELVDDDYSDAGSDRTEVLSEDDGSSGVRTARRLSYGETATLERMPTMDDSGLREQKDTEDLVDSDASTDDEDDDNNAGSSRKSFTAVRAEAVRSSGLAAACYVTSKKLAPDTNDISNDMDGLKDGNANARNMSSESIRLDNWKKDIRDISFLSNKITDLDVSRMPTQGFYKEGVNSGSSKAMIRKLFDEAELSEKAGSMINTELIADQEDLHLSGTDLALAGLSYINSQEPGEFSQVNALEVVDKFLLINDMESYEEIKIPKSGIIKCSVSCIKGAQLLAEKTDRRSPVGKVNIFEWNDNLEDEGGGDFFFKRKDTFYEGASAAQKSKCPLSRVSHSASAIGRDAFSKSRKTKIADPLHSKKITNANSESRLTMQHSPKFSMLHTSEAKSRKSLFKDIDERSNSELLRHKLEATNGEDIFQDAYDVGPNTQMAAEVLESLVHVSPLNPTKKDKSPHSRTSTKKFSKVSATKELYSENALFQKRNLSADSVGVITLAKRRKILPIDTTIQNPKSCIDHTGNSRAKNRSDKTALKVVKNDKLKVGTKVDSGSINGKVTSKSLNKVKTKGKESSLLDDAKKIHGRMTLNDRILTRKVLTVRDAHGNCTPVASRTRQSKKVNLLKQPKTLLKEDDFHESVLIDKNTEGAIQKQHSLDRDVSRLMETRIGIPNKGLHPKEGNKISLTQCEVQIHGKMFQGETKAGLENSIFNHPKRRRTQISSGKQTSINNANDPSVSENVMAKVGRNSKQIEMKKVCTRSVADILDKVIRKKRSVSARILMESDHLPLTTCEPMTSGVKTRLSLYQMDLNNNFNERLSNQTSPKNISKMVVDHHSSGEVNHTSHLGEVISRKSRADYYDNLEYNATPEGVQSDKEIAVVSPVCLSKDPPKIPKKTSSATSLAREFHRLETVVVSTSPILKDVRRRKDMASVRVLFSQHLDEDTIKQQKKILARFGLKLASSISDATHFVTGNFVRTQNMLEAIAVGKPVVTPMWLESCGQEHCFIDERNYILRDSKKEKEIGFSMPVSLARACRCPLLKNKRVYVTPNVKPSQSVITSLVTATCGQAIERIGRSMMKQDKMSDELLVISCDEDYSICLPLLKKGSAVFSSELLLNGIVIQKLEYERHRLFLDHVKKTRSTIWLRPEDGGKLVPVTRGV